MEEMKGMAIALSVLGEKIANLEEELRYVRLCKESAEKSADVLRERNEILCNQLSGFIQKDMEEEAEKEERRMHDITRYESCDVTPPKNKEQRTKNIEKEGITGGNPDPDNW